jgi:hypothetical protein
MPKNGTIQGMRRSDLDLSSMREWGVDIPDDIPVVTDLSHLKLVRLPEWFEFEGKAFGAITADFRLWEVLIGRRPMAPSQYACGGEFITIWLRRLSDGSVKVFFACKGTQEDTEATAQVSYDEEIKGDRRRANRAMEG